MSGLAAQVQQLQGKLLADGIVDEQFLQLQVTISGSGGLISLLVECVHSCASVDSGGGPGSTSTATVPQIANPSAAAPSGPPRQPPPIFQGPSRAQELEDEANPDFLQEVCEMFFHDGEQKLVALGQLLVRPLGWRWGRACRPRGTKAVFAANRSPPRPAGPGPHPLATTRLAGAPAEGQQRIHGGPANIGGVRVHAPAVPDAKLGRAEGGGGAGAAGLCATQK